MRLSDYNLIKEIITGMVDANRMPVDVGDEIIEKVHAEYNNTLAAEIMRQRNMRIRHREHWADTPEGLRVRQLEKGEWFVVPTDKRRMFASVKNALNKLEIYGRFQLRRREGVGEILTRIE